MLLVSNEFFYSMSLISLQELPGTHPEICPRIIFFNFLFKTVLSEIKIATQLQLPLSPKRELIPKKIFSEIDTFNMPPFGPT